MAVYIGHDECRVIYVAKNGQQLRVSSIWVGDQQVFPPANRQEIHAFTRDTQGYGRTDNGTHFAFTLPVPWWATSADVVVLGAGEKGRDGTRSFSGGTDGAGGRSGAWVVRTIALTQATDAVVSVGKGTSTSPHATEVILPGVGGQADVRVHDGEGTRTPNSGSTGGSVTPRQRTEYNQLHTGGAGGSRNSAGSHPGGGGGGGQGANLLGTPQSGSDGGDGYVWLRFRSAPGIEVVIIRVGVSSGDAFTPLREWAVSIGKTHETITGITMPMEVIGPSLRRLFYECSSLTSVPELDTSNVTDMYSMFYGCQALTTIPALDTSQSTDTQFMFYECSSLVSVPELDTGQVTTMRSMFYNCSSLATIPELDTGQVTTMRSMFYNCSSLATIPELDTGQVTDMQYMFYRCSSLVSVPELDTSQVTDMRDMFYNCSSLTSVPDMDTGQVADMQYMLYGCSSLETIPALDTGQVTTMRSMFYNCQALTTIPELDTSNVTNMQYMLYGCSSLESVPDMDTGQVTTMNAMFYKCQSLVSAPALDTSQVTDMQWMLSDCSSLVSVPALASHQVTNINNMFRNCSSLESVTLPGMGNGFTTAQTLGMSDTKLNAAAANALMHSLGTTPSGGTLQLPATAAGADTSIAASKNWTVTIGGDSSAPDPGDEISILRVGVSSGHANAPLREWAASTGKTYETITEITVPMEVIGPSLHSLFRGCQALVSVPALDTSQVTDMYALFRDCQALVSVPALDTSKVTEMGAMFYNCSSLTSIPDLDTSQVTEMGSIFFGCSSLESVTLPGMGNAFTTGSSEFSRTLNMRATKLNAAAANALMQSLGTPPPGGTLQLPTTAAGADTSIATSKNWTVTIG